MAENREENCGRNGKRLNQQGMQRRARTPEEEQAYYQNRQGGEYNGQGGYYQGAPDDRQGGYYQGSPNGQQGGYYQGSPNGQQGGYYQGNPNGRQGGYYQGNPNGRQGGYYQGNPNGQQGGYYQEAQNGPGNGYYQGGPNGYYQQGNQQGYYEEPDGGKKGRKGKRKKKHRKLIFAIEIIVLLVLALGLFGAAQLGRMGRIHLKDIVVNNGLTSKKGYRNLALFGVDSRDGELDGGTNSDTIMVCSINQKTGEIRLVSVYRDTYLDVNEGSYSKANSAYAGGGPERAINMLNKNLDLDITDFATVDFSAVIEAVDLLGGIDIELTDEEVKWLNAYLVETSQVTGVSYENVQSSGMQHLSGIQAMAYCRIRYTEGWDYKRTERQRLVLEKIFEGAKSQGVTTLASMIGTMMPYIKTSLSNTEIIALAADIGKYTIADTQGFPYDQVAADVDAGDCVVPVNLAANVKQLHEYLFGDTDYTVSDTVQQISNQIINNTGIQ
ncbi:MAG: LCP family protein [Lachnospiraceae bacterium]